MLYKTHQQFGKLATVAAVPFAIKYNLLPAAPDFNLIKINPLVYFVNCLPLIVAAAIAYVAGIWGSGYPDIDSPGSVPARTNPLVSWLFKVFGVKHRGRFSHSLLSITLTFGALFALVKFLFPVYLGNVLTAGMVDPRLAEYIVMFKSVCGLASIWVIFAYIGAVSHWIGDLLTVDGAYFGWEHKIKMFNSSFFKAGSSWETKFWTPLTKISYLPALVFVIVLIFGQINLLEVVANLRQ